jgi:hypothetical protein
MLVLLVAFRPWFPLSPSFSLFYRDKERRGIRRITHALTRTLHSAHIAQHGLGEW